MDWAKTTARLDGESFGFGVTYIGGLTVIEISVVSAVFLRAWENKAMPKTFGVTIFHM